MLQTIPGHSRSGHAQERFPLLKTGEKGMTYSLPRKPCHSLSVFLSTWNYTAVTHSPQGKTKCRNKCRMCQLLI